MRSRHLVLGLLLLVPFVGCKAKEDARAQALEQVAAARASAGVGTAQATDQLASARAVASAVEARLVTSITGKVHSVGGELGTWDITLNDCKSGEIAGFFGVDFTAPGSEDLRLRYVHDEGSGDVVKVMYPSNKTKARVFDRSDTCAVLEGSVEKTNISAWTPKGKVRYLNGHVKFDCTQTGGKGRVTGEATFAGCH
jgi:hypothetical protein